MEIPKLNYLLIGAGGVASYFLPPFLKTFLPDSICFYDGDILEERNLDRQLFHADDIGRNKGDALIMRNVYKENWSVKVIPEYFTEASITEHKSIEFDAIICMADNHVARKNALAAADEWGIPAFIGGNEYFTSQAFAYLPQWKGQQHDPRIRYPEILTDVGGDPTACTGVDAESTPQLALANSTCATFILQLCLNWLVTLSELSDDPELVAQKLSIEYNSNFTGITTTTINSLQGELSHA